MTKERFIEIIREYGFRDSQINEIWDQRPSDNLSEAGVRTAAVCTAKRFGIIRKTET